MCTFVYRSVAIFVKTLDGLRPITAAIATELDTDLLVSGNTMAKILLAIYILLRLKK